MGACASSVGAHSPLPAACPAQPLASVRAEELRTGDLLFLHDQRHLGQPSYLSKGANGLWSAWTHMGFLIRTGPGLDGLLVVYSDDLAPASCSSCGSLPPAGGSCCEGSRSRSHSRSIKPSPSTSISARSSSRGDSSIVLRRSLAELCASGRFDTAVVRQLHAPLSEQQQLLATELAWLSVGRPERPGSSSRFSGRRHASVLMASLPDLGSSPKDSLVHCQLRSSLLVCEMLRAAGQLRRSDEQGVYTATHAQGLLLRPPAAFNVAEVAALGERIQLPTQPQLRQSRNSSSHKQSQPARMQLAVASPAS